MNNTDETWAASAEDLSALLDGELPTAEVGRACNRWRSEPSLQSSWHLYHLIGDAMRSDDLATPPPHDRDFLQGLRQRLAQEQVVLARSSFGIGGASKAPLLTPDETAAEVGRIRHRLRHATPFATAAGFVMMMVVGTWSLMPRSSAPDGVAAAAAAAGPALAYVASSSERLQSVATALPSVAPLGAAPTTDLDGQLIRDTRLDEYLAAHKRFGGSSAPGGPSGFLRQAILESR